MMNNNQKHSNCGFSEQLVSYLYGESGIAEKAVFETHLKSCAGCAEELEAFSGVHFSINDWKLQEFAGLAAPSIEIPYEKAAIMPEESSVSDSWWSTLRGVFSPSSRGWSLAAASFAVIAVVVGISLFALNSRKDKDVAGSNKTNPVVLPTAEKTAEPTNAKTDQNKQPDKEVTPQKEPKSTLPEIAIAPDPKNNRIVKASNNPRPVQRNGNPNVQKGIEAKRPNKNNETAPKIMPADDEEDNTLRLAELFDEIDTKE
jgi:hypothetical protein